MEIENANITNFNIIRNRVQFFDLTRVVSKSFNLTKDISKEITLYYNPGYLYFWIFYSVSPPGLHKKGRWTNDGIWGTTQLWYG